MKWYLSDNVEPDWADVMEDCGGGFFHSPAWVDVESYGLGEGVYARLLDGSSPVGVAVGRRRRCRLGSRGHVYFPSLPAVADCGSLPFALDLLRSDLATGSDAEVTFDSFDSRCPTDGQPSRLELVLPVDRDAAAMMRSFSSTHRRKARAGESAGFTIRTLAGKEATDMLFDVQRVASERARERGDPFYPPRISVPGAGLPALRGEWGAALFVVEDADRALLCAALVGWGGKRAFYVAGGSTPRGYSAGAAIWMHWQVMAAASEAGLHVYNLGGVPASATRENDPAHGLYRWKCGFGAEIVPLRGSGFVLRPGHMRLHRLAGWLKPSSVAS
jgi:hypothetical protein